MRRLTVGEAADLLERFEPDLPADYFARQLRGFVQRDFIAPLGYRGSGRTAAAEFGPRELCLARVLSALSRLGLPLEVLRSVQWCFRNVRPQDVWSQELDPPALGFELATRGVAAGQQWFFVLRIHSGPKADDAEHGSLGGWFCRSLEPLTPSGPFLTALVLDASHLFAPVLLHFASPSGPDGEPAPSVSEPSGSELPKEVK